MFTAEPSPNYHPAMLWQNATCTRASKAANTPPSPPTVRQHALQTVTMPLQLAIAWYATLLQAAFGTTAQSTTSLLKIAPTQCQFSQHQAAHDMAPQIQLVIPCPSNQRSDTSTNRSAPAHTHCARHTGSAHLPRYVVEYCHMPFPGPFCTTMC